MAEEDHGVSVGGVGKPPQGLGSSRGGSVEAVPHHAFGHELVGPLGREERPLVGRHVREHHVRGDDLRLLARVEPRGDGLHEVGRHMAPHEVDSVVARCLVVVLRHLVHHALHLGGAEHEVEVEHLHLVDRHGVGEVAPAARGEGAHEVAVRAHGAGAELEQPVLVESRVAAVLRHGRHLAELVGDVEDGLARHVDGDVDVVVVTAPVTSEGLEREVVRVADRRGARKHERAGDDARGGHAHEDAMVRAVRLGNAATLRERDEARLRLRAARERRHRLGGRGMHPEGMEDLVGAEDAREDRAALVAKRAGDAVHEDRVAHLARAVEAAVGGDLALLGHEAEAGHEPSAHEVRVRVDAAHGDVSVPADHAIPDGFGRHGYYSPRPMRSTILRPSPEASRASRGPKTQVPLVHDPSARTAARARTSSEAVASSCWRTASRHPSGLPAKASVS